MSLEVTGSIGSKQVIATISNKSVVFKDKKKVILEMPFDVICLQRISNRLKTCDIVYLNLNIYKIQTINQKEIEKIMDVVQCPIYSLGPDPLEWNKIYKTAIKNQWKLEDWQYFLEDKNSDMDDNEPSSDEWVPDSENESSSDSEED
jgi:hypothetical protein